MSVNFFEKERINNFNTSEFQNDIKNKFNSESSVDDLIRKLRSSYLDQKPLFSFAVSYEILKHLSSTPYDYSKKISSVVRYLGMTKCLGSQSIEKIQKISEIIDFSLNHSNPHFAAELYLLIQEELRGLSAKSQTSETIELSLRWGLLFDQQLIIKLVSEGLISVNHQINRVPLLAKVMDIVPIKANKQALACWLIRNDAALDHRNPSGFNYLHSACAKDLPEVAEQLLIKNFDPNDNQNDKKAPPIFIAINSQSVQLLRLLLKAGADPNVYWEEETPITVCCSLKWRLGIQELLAYEAYQPTQNLTFYQVLKDCFQERWKEEALMLLKHEGNASLYSEQLDSLCQIAWQNQDFDLIEVLLDFGLSADSLVNFDDESKPLLLAALEKGEEQLAIKLIEKGASLLSKGESYLSVACRCALEKAALLIFKKSPSRGEYYLHHACRHGLLKILKKILRVYLWVNETDDRGIPPLHHAVQSRSTAAVKIMIKHDAEINQCDANGQSPLDLAYNNQDIEMGILLLENGLNIFSIESDEGAAMPYIRSITRPILEKFPAFWSKFEQVESMGELSDILVSNTQFLIDPQYFLPGANPFSALALFSLGDDVRRLKAHVSLEDFHHYFIEHIRKYVKLRHIYDTLIKIDPTHYAHATQSAIPPLSEAPQIDLDQLPLLFLQIPFTKDPIPGGRDPEKLTNEGYPTDPDELCEGIRTLVSRIKDRTELVGTPKKGTAEFDSYYDRFECVVKLITDLIINKLEPDEKTSALIDLAIFGLHCGAKITEACNMYLILKGEPVGGILAAIANELQSIRKGLLVKWSEKKEEDEAYTAHFFNQLMHLLGRDLNLPFADQYLQPDPLRPFDDKENWLEKFERAYSPFQLFKIMRSMLLRFFKDAKLSPELVDLLRDSCPESWRKEQRNAILMSLREWQTSGYSREKIFSELERVHGIYLPADPKPLEILLNDQKDRYMAVKDPRVTLQEWNKEWYGGLAEDIERMELDKEPLDRIYTYLRERQVNVPPMRPIEECLKQFWGVNYLQEEFFIMDEESYQVTGINPYELLRLMLKLQIIEPRLTTYLPRMDDSKEF